MPDIGVGNIMQVRIEYEALGQKDLSVLHWRVKAAAGGVEMFNFLKNKVNAEAVEADGLLDTLRQDMSEQMKIVGIVSQIIKPIRFRHIRTGCDYPGTDVGELGTNNLAVAVTQSGILAGRGKAGRTSVPGFGKKWCIGGKWEAGVQNKLRDLFTLWRTIDWTPNGSGVTLEPIIYNPATGAVNLCVAIDVQPTVRVMRRRTLGVGQ